MCVSRPWYDTKVKWVRKKSVSRYTPICMTRLLRRRKGDKGLLLSGRRYGRRICEGAMTKKRVSSGRVLVNGSSAIWMWSREV